MKKLLLTLSFIIGITTVSFGQVPEVSVLTDGRMDAIYNKISKKWEYFKNNETQTFFEIYEKLSIVKHIKPSSTSIYFIKGKPRIDKESNEIRLHLVNDEGKEFGLRWAFNHNNIQITPYDSDAATVVYKIKKTWTEEE